MKILVVGGGGREHAIVMKLAESPQVEALYCAPGNGGIAKYAKCFPVKATDIDGMIKLAKELAVDLVFVAPDDPLVLGMADAMQAEGFMTFGPKKNAAILEGSKVFSKELMQKYHIPTAEYRVFDKPQEAEAYLKEKNEYPTVIKADGLALGKGVVIAQNEQEAFDAIASIMEDKIFGESGSKVVIEEFLTGPEVSVLSFTDGKTVKPMVSSMDHKRALDGDQGLNTGGMGTVAPNPYYTPEIAQQCMDTIFLPTIRAGGGQTVHRLSVFRTDADTQGTEGHRVQLPVRRSGNTGGSAAAGYRSGRHYAGDLERYIGSAGHSVERRLCSLRSYGKRRLSEKVCYRSSDRWSGRKRTDCKLLCLPCRHQAGRGHIPDSRRSCAGRYSNCGNSAGGTGHCLCRR